MTLKRRIFVGVATVCLLLVIGMVTVRTRRGGGRPMPPVVIVSPNMKQPATARDHFAAALSSRSEFLSRMEEKVFGKREAFNVNAVVFRLESTDVAELKKGAALDTPTFEDGELSVWFMDGAEFRQAGEQVGGLRGVEIVSRPKVFATEGAPASMFVGQTIMVEGRSCDVGFSMACIGWLNERTTDLLATLSNTAAVHNDVPLVDGISARDSMVLRTNLDVSLRMQIPKGRGVLMIKVPSGSQERVAFGALIEPPQS